MNINFNNLPIVKVLWKDARTYSGKVFSYNEFFKMSLADSETIGYLLMEDKEKVYVSGFVYIADEDELDDGLKDIHLIPKSWIKKIIYLEEKRSGGKKK